MDDLENGVACTRKNDEYTSSSAKQNSIEDFVIDIWFTLVPKVPWPGNTNTNTNISMLWNEAPEEYSTVPTYLDST